MKNVRTPQHWFNAIVAVLLLGSVWSSLWQQAQIETLQEEVQFLFEECESHFCDPSHPDFAHEE